MKKRSIAEADHAKNPPSIFLSIDELKAPEPTQAVQLPKSKKISDPNDKILPSNKWLECMDAFADGIRNVKIPESSNPVLNKDITVALIDDGADPYVESLRGKIIGGDSFDESSEDPPPYYTPPTKHGTFMAHMICRVCPLVKLYVYRLETHAVEKGTEGQTREQMSAMSAAEVST
jgi:hypothetical protein